MSNPIWLDQENASLINESSNATDLEKSVARSIIETGVAIIPAAHDPDLCKEVINDYMNYAKINHIYVQQNLDNLGREKRLVNFHLWSDAAAKIGTNPKIMSILDYLFNQESSIYTSLTFKYGSQQPVHRDTPHFATWPKNYFFGIWTALETIKPDAGPLFYHPKAHRFTLNTKQYWDEARLRLPHSDRAEQLHMALDLYNGEVIRTAPNISEAIILDLKVGDTVIWHPELPHGGTPSIDPHLTRWSIVFHCAPSKIQVHQHDTFFTHDNSTSPPDRYNYLEVNNRKVAQIGETAFM